MLTFSTMRSCMQPLTKLRHHLSSASNNRCVCGRVHVKPVLVSASIANCQIAPLGTTSKHSLVLSTTCCLPLLMLQDVLGVAELQGPVLDPALLNNSLTLSSQDMLQLYPLHARSSTGSRVIARMHGASSTTTADSSSRQGTAGSSKSNSSKRGRKKHNKLQQIDVPAEPAQDEVLLAGMANSIQQANSLLRCNDNLYRTAVDGVDGLLVSRMPTCSQT